MSDVASGEVGEEAAEPAGGDPRAVPCESGVTLPGAMLLGTTSDPARGESEVATDGRASPAGLPDGAGSADGGGPGEDPVRGAGADGPFNAPIGYRLVGFVDVVVVLPSPNPLLVLQESDPPYREVRIPIGAAEGTAIAYAARGIETPRPLTHELFATVLETFDLSLAVVRITAVSGSSFSAELVLSSPSGSRVLSCRVSDGVALSLRQRLPAPIVISPDVLDQVGSDPTLGN